jgi:hypothetical protein
MTLEEIWQTDPVFQFSEGIVSGPGGKILADGSDLYILIAGNLVKADKNKKITTIEKGMDQRINGL